VAATACIALEPALAARFPEEARAILVAALVLAALVLFAAWILFIAWFWSRSVRALEGRHRYPPH
jgi:hypothetical protein